MKGHREPWYLDRLRAELERVAAIEDRRERGPALGRLRPALGRLRPSPQTLVALAVVLALVAVVLAVAWESDVERQAAPQPAPGEKVFETDVFAGIQWSLDGRVLTVRLLPNDASHETFSRARISATCGTNIAAPPGDPRRETTLTRLWPAGQTSMSYRFPRDVSRWCRLEDQPGSIIAFMTFPGASPGTRELITETADNWARLFASNAVEITNVDTETRIPNVYMAQPALEQMYCQRDERPIPNCTRPSRAYQQSFRDATVQEIAIKGDRAAARFSNGETIELQSTDRGWLVDKFGENAGRGFFK